MMHEQSLSAVIQTKPAQSEGSATTTADNFTAKSRQKGQGSALLESGLIEIMQFSVVIMWRLHPTSVYGW